MKKLWFLMPLTYLLASCSPSPKPIQFGSDMCHYCKMTIVDHQHAAQLVTLKGKVTSYDAIECMINFIDDNPELKFAFVLVSDFYEPAELIDAKKAQYLVSPNLPSPMGEYLTAFSNQKDAESMQQEKSGDIYNWDQIQTHINSGLSSK